MPQPFDPYEQWLDIPPDEQPADCYRLLGLARFETDAGKIAAAADERMGRLRSYQMGPRGAYTQKLLNELAAARVRLLDPSGKAQYDWELAHRLSELEASRRASAPRPVNPAAVSLATAGPTVEVAATPVASAARSRAAKNANWRVTLVVTSCVVAIGLAGGGWAISQWNFATQPSGRKGGGKTIGSSAVEQTSSAAAAAKNENASAVLSPDHEGVVHCPAGRAAIRGGLKLREAADGGVLGEWNSLEDEAAWQFRVRRPGFFQWELTFAATDLAEGTQLDVQINDKARRVGLRPTGGLDVFETHSVTIAVERSGLQRLAIRPRTPRAGEWLVVRSVRLVPIERNATP